MPVARSNGLRISYEVFGEGPPLVLHPGMFQVGAHWSLAGYSSTLAATHAVITVDPLGLGGSDAPRDPAAYALPRRADYVTAVLDAVGVERAAFWGYSLGALTGYAVAVHAPERLTRLVAGAFDPLDGFRSAIDPMLRALGLPADADPYPLVERAALAHPAFAAVIEAADSTALRANYAAYSREPGLHAELAAADVPMLMYAGTADPWHEPMRIFAERTGAAFFSLPDADHVRGWNDSAGVLPRVLPFLARDLPV
ncbi:alpha/beta fold hydrolase [Saccharopolyspora erythraea]|uniref:alpha/beta fold hydrolase n=1 Tax=Saccharopolyspora erythraea TaxID=1836 RepID=UPI001BA4F7F9|nr:alpha/beta fold hydrolase [Saccharopolyspora erythraea]QUH04390.1 alpha/beta fold hydrolase [Saccharopolyspora erythraea]